MSKSKGKVFVGGLSWQTTNEEFEDFFADFGEIIDSVVMRKEDGKSRGFGFVTFANPAHAEDVLNRDIELGGRRVDCKPAVPRDQLSGRMDGGRAPVSRMGPRTSKIFVGGLSKDTTKEEFEHYFAKYGQITDGIVMTDRETGRSRGFGFITFESEASADKVVSQAVHIISGKQVETKKAIPKAEINTPRVGYGNMMNAAFQNPYASGGYRRPQQAYVGAYGAQAAYGMPNPGYAAYLPGIAPQPTRESLYAQSRESLYASGASLYGGYMPQVDPSLFGGAESAYGGAVRGAARGSARSLPRDRSSSYHPYSRGR